MIMEMIHNMVGIHEGVSLFCGIGERCREGESKTGSITDELLDIVSGFEALNRE